MQTQTHQIHTGDVLDVLKSLPDNYFDAVLLPSRAGIPFSNEQVPGLVLQVQRVLRPDAPPLGLYSDDLARLLLPPTPATVELDVPYDSEGCAMLPAGWDVVNWARPDEMRLEDTHVAVLARPQRRILVPFSGSGSEMIGALKAGWDEVQGIELSAEYVDIAHARIAHHCPASVATAVGQDGQAGSAA